MMRIPLSVMMHRNQLPRSPPVSSSTGISVGGLIITILEMRSTGMLPGKSCDAVFNDSRGTNDEQQNKSMDIK
jgi:hypothetical protein